MYIVWYETYNKILKLKKITGSFGVIETGSKLKEQLAGLYAIVMDEEVVITFRLL